MSAPTTAPTLGLRASLDYQLEFARHNFENHQALIRFTDTKVAAIMTLMMFLAASLIPVAKEAVSHLGQASAWEIALSAFFLLSSAAFCGAFVSLIAAVQSVIRPRGARQQENVPKEERLLWQEHVLGHGSPTDYFLALRNAQPEVLLKNVTDQVFELATILKEKMAGIAAARRAMWWAFGFWVANVAASFLLLRK